VRGRAIRPAGAFCREAASAKSGAGPKDPVMPQTSDMPRTLTRRYMLALTVLAVLATMALIGTDAVISRQDGTAELMNIAGRQRMLSQRAVLYAERLTSASAEQREDARQELRDAIDQLAGRHAELIAGGSALGLPGMTPGLRRLYFDGPNAIDTLMSRFLAAARSLASKSSSGPVANDDPDLVLMNQLGTTRLLAALDRAVNHYEADGEAAITYLRLLEVVVWLVGLLVLTGTGLLIFAPMVRRLKENLGETAAVTAALAESEERFALGAQGASVGIRDHFDPRQDEEYWSPQLYHLLGYVPGELAARASSFNKLVHPGDRQLFHDAVSRHLEEHTALEFECRLLHKRHGYRWFLVTGQAKWTADGVPRRLITTIKDIDDRVQAERMRSEFVSTVSHELRTPLTSIMGALGLMRSRVVGPLSDRAQQLATIAYDNCDRLVRLINDLLEVEKMEAGKIAFDFKAESLERLLTQAKQQNEIFAEQHGATIVVEPVEHDIAIEVDEVRFAQVMANLLSNAAKYSPPGGQITIATQLLDGAVRISVSDQGPGVPAEFRQRIFERFAQADASGGRKKGGTGLGLNIAKAIVEAHKGRIGFDTTDGQGTTFYFVLPTDQSGVVPAPVAEDVSEVVGIPTEEKIEHPRLARLLLVATEAGVCSAIAHQVADLAELTTVSSCGGAVPLVARRAFDLIILDRAGLHCDGGVISQALSDRGGPAPPIVVYGASGKEAPALPTALTTLIKAEVDEQTLRQAVLDELRHREEQLATRFKKSA
jgi:PAS domain S-box-containing protein